MSIWPWFDLEIKSANISLKIPSDQQLFKIAEKFPNGKSNFLAKEQEDFLAINWPAQESPQFEMSFLAHHWLSRTQTTTNAWRLNFGIFIPQHNYPISFMSIQTENFKNNPEGKSGSWILPQYRGQGYATVARKSIIKLGFEYLHLDRMVSDAHPENIASNLVSKKLGYKENGYKFHKGASSQEWFKSQLWLLEKKNYSGYPEITVHNFPKHLF